ncbi:MAG: hypothetical protein MJY92_01700 [Bacteroidales bacterium]|nr:hypothetical protein [Bacteroidales bacterium]
MEPVILFDANLRLYINVPAYTKSSDFEDYGSTMNQEGMDNQIVAEDLSVYFFDLNGKLVSVCNSNQNMVVSKVSTEDYDPHYHLYCADLKVEGISNNIQYRIVVVANSRSIYTANMPFAVPSFPVGPDFTEQQLYESLKFGYSNDKFTFGNHVGFYTMENFNMFERAAVPMWGFKTMSVEVRGANNHDKLQVSGTIHMIRSVAKVKINISDDLMKYVVVTDHNPNSVKGGARLFYPMENGYMTPAYSKVSSLAETPSMMNKDRAGEKSDGAYTNVWLNTGDFKSDVETQICYPFYRHTDRTFYTYLPECELGRAWMKIEFRWKDSQLLDDPSKDFRLEFADYAFTGAAPTDEDIDCFPVMRNHYYIYNIIGLNPLKVKYEVCEWDDRETEIIFD